MLTSTALCFLGLLLNRPLTFGLNYTSVCNCGFLSGGWGSPDPCCICAAVIHPSIHQPIAPPYSGQGHGGGRVGKAGLMHGLIWPLYQGPKLWGWVVFFFFGHCSCSLGTNNDLQSTQVIGHGERELWMLWQSVTRHQCTQSYTRANTDTSWPTRIVLCDMKIIY